MSLTYVSGKTGRLITHPFEKYFTRIYIGDILHRSGFQPLYYMKDVEITAGIPVPLYDGDRSYCLNIVQCLENAKDNILKETYQYYKNGMNITFEEFKLYVRWIKNYLKKLKGGYRCLE